MATRDFRVRFIGDTRSLEAAFGRAGIASQSLGRKMETTGRNLTRTLTLPIVGAGVVAGKFAVDFDKSMRNVNSIAQLPEPQFKKLSDSVLGLAGKTAQAPRTLAEGLYDLVSSGFDAKDSMTILESSAKAATAGLTTTEVSTKAVAAVLNAYRMPASKASVVSDELFRTVDRGVITFEELSTNIGDVLPFASSLGVKLAEVGAATATMTKAGISAPETMTRIKNVMVTLLKPGTELKGAFKELGVESGEALIKQKGLQGALDALIGTTDGSKKAVAALFPNIRAMGGALALTGKNAADAREDLKGMKDAAGATDRALSQQSKSIAFVVQKGWAQLQAALIRVGQVLLPIAAELIPMMANALAVMLEGLAALPGPFKAVAFGALGFLAALGPLLIIGGKLLTMYRAVAAVLLVYRTGAIAARSATLGMLIAQKLHTATLIAGIAAQWALNVAMRANPIGLVITAIAALVAAILIVTKKTGIFTAIWEVAKKVIGAVWKFLKAAAGDIFPVIRKMAEFGLLGPIPFIIARWKMVKSVLGTIWNAIKDIARAIWGLVKDQIVDRVSSAYSWLRDKTQGIRDWLRDAWGRIKDIAGTVWNAIKDKMTAPIQKAAGIIKDIVNWIIKNVINRIPGVEIGTIGGGAPGKGIKPFSKSKPQRGEPGLAMGGLVTAPMALVGEEGPAHPEFVLATNPAYRRRNQLLWALAGKELGVPGFQFGGIVEGIGKAAGAAVGFAKGLAGKIPTPGDLIGKVKDVVGGLPDWLGGLGKWIIERLTGWIKDKLTFGIFGGGGGGGTGPVPSGSLRDWLTTALRIVGVFTPGNLAALFGRAMQESGGNPRAINLWDINARMGIPSKGLLQTIDPTFNAYRLPGMGNIWNPIHNAVAAIRYMLDRYGHIVGPSATGYAQGGVVGMVGEQGPELLHMPTGARVHSAAETRAMLAPEVRVFIGERELTDIVRVELREGERRSRQAYRAGVRP